MKIRHLRSVFMVLLVISFINFTLLNLKYPTFWKHWLSAAGVSARKTNSKGLLTISISETPTQAHLMPTSPRSHRFSAIPAHKVTRTKPSDSNSNERSHSETVSDDEELQSDERGLLAISFTSSQQKDALFRRWDRIEPSQPFWQPVDDNMDVLTYSAHYDDVEQPPVVRVVGVARDPLPFGNVTCRYYGCLRCLVMRSVAGSVAHFRSRNGRRYLGAYVLCPLPSSDSVLPFAASIHKENMTSGTRPLLVHYSNTTHARQATRVQRLMKQYDIAPHERDPLDVLESLWTYVRHGNTKEPEERYMEDLHSKLRSHRARRNVEADTKRMGQDGQKAPGVKTNSHSGDEDWEEEEEEEKTKDNKDTIDRMTHNETAQKVSGGSSTDTKHTSTVVVGNSKARNNNTKIGLSVEKIETHNPKDPHHRNPTSGNSQRSSPELRNTSKSSLSSSSGSSSSNSNSINRRAEDGRAGGYRWNVTRCFPAFQKNFNKHVELVEMVAASRTLGVDHFVFYVESVGPAVNATLQLLESHGLAEVLPWNLHVRDGDVFYKGQFSAIQDCLYRHLRSSRYVLTGDVDEIFMPKSQDSLVTLLDTCFAKQPNCGSFTFLHSYFNINLPPQPPTSPSAPPPPLASQHHPNANNKTTTTITNNKNANTTNNKNSSTISSSSGTSNNNNLNAQQPNSQQDVFLNNHYFSLALKYDLPMYLHTLRHVQIHRAGTRSKIALDPRRVLVGSVHVVAKLRRGFRSCILNARDGLLHHYRSLVSTKTPVVEDAGLRLYGDRYLQEAVSLLEEVEKRERQREKERDRKRRV